MGFEEWYSEIFKDDRTPSEKRFDEEWRRIDRSSNKSMWEFIYKWFYPENPRPNWACKIGFHRFRGHNEYQASLGMPVKFTGVCTRCGKIKLGTWMG